MEQNILNYTLDALRGVLAIDSPTGFTDRAAAYVADLLREMGYEPTLTKKGGVLCCLGGQDADNGILLSVHIDTLGAIVSQVKGNGRLKLAPMSLCATNTEAENVLVYTRTGKTVPGTIQLINPSVHVNPDYKTAPRNFDTVECVLDEDVPLSLQGKGISPAVRRHEGSRKTGSAGALYQHSLTQNGSPCPEQN